jgi:hypothetical protein
MFFCSVSHRQFELYRAFDSQKTASATHQRIAKGLSPQEALVSLLIASAREDGSVSQTELRTLLSPK